eukprot:TRINITY_DN7778_c0_g1_i1.p1 TRINITY_DN7778_c0_g1~~TRINITY_DN7778_c0_g1_i1.p1  ORF type:complete len:109 (-),score=2.08 TRINITY_DN7778_c0_g1_i1:40-366(-)
MRSFHSSNLKISHRPTKQICENSPRKCGAHINCSLVHHALNNNNIDSLPKTHVIAKIHIALLLASSFAFSINPNNNSSKIFTVFTSRRKVKTKITKDLLGGTTISTDP